MVAGRTRKAGSLANSISQWGVLVLECSAAHHLNMVTSRSTIMLDWSAGSPHSDVATVIRKINI